jgi:hypothetical protein
MSLSQNRFTLLGDMHRIVVRQHTVWRQAGKPWSAAHRWARKGRSNTLNLRMILSENRFRFSGSCANDPE